MKIRSPKLIFNNPISENKLDEILNLLEIQKNDTIIDIGGGNGAVLNKMIEESEANGVLIELSKTSINECKNTSPKLIDSGKLKIVELDAQEYLSQIDLESIDCAVSIGSSYALGGYENLIKKVLPYLKVGGFIIIGDEFWKQKPNSDYLKVLGADVSDSRFHYENIELGENLGLTYLYSQVASESDWNTFEGMYFLEEEIKLTSNEKKSELTQLRSFRRAQFRYGRNTMGFGLYLFKK